MLEGTLNTFGNVEPWFGSIYKRITRNVSKRESDHAMKRWANNVDRGLGEYFGEYGNVIGAIVAGSMEGLSPEAISQAWSVGKDLQANILGAVPDDPQAQALAIEAAGRTQGILDLIGHVAGLKQRELSYEDDYIPGLLMDKLVFSKANTEFKQALASADSEGYYEDFVKLNAIRKMAWQQLQDRIQAGSDILHKSPRDIIRDTSEAGQAFRTAGDSTLREFIKDRYDAPSPAEYMDYLKASTTLDLTREEIRQAGRNYRDAYRRYREENK